jgi:hypothetical protein
MKKYPSLETCRRQRKKRDELKDRSAILWPREVKSYTYNIQDVNVLSCKFESSFFFFIPSYLFEGTVVANERQFEIILQMIV